MVPSKYFEVPLKAIRNNIDVGENYRAFSQISVLIHLWQQDTVLL